MADAAVKTVDTLTREWEVTRLAQCLREYFSVLRARHRVDSLALFSSYVGNEQRPESGLDVLIEFDKTPGLLEFVGIQQDLSDMLGLPVDLVTPSTLRSSLREIILGEAVALWHAASSGSTCGTYESASTGRRATSLT